jgi:WD40 repeat protein
MGPTLPLSPSEQPASVAAPGSNSAAVPGYEILGELGRGGMGVVYRARQIALNRTVALKMILAGGHAGAADLRRFRAEAEALAGLQHPNVVQVHEVGEHDGLAYFSLELCPGGSLAQRLKGTPLAPPEAARLVETLARAVHAAHQKGVVHRDLSPGNVLFAADGAPKVSDFGLAKRLDGATRTASGAVMGTPSYMAPEQAAGRSKEVGPAADVYALGAILYECLTGRPPFKAASALDTLLQVLGDEPVAPRSLNARVPLDAETICLKCLHKEPARRYASALALAEDLRRFLAGEPIAARPVGAFERCRRWARRNPVVAALAAAVVLVLAAGVGVSGYFAVSARQEAAAARKAEGEAGEALAAARTAEGQTAEALAQAREQLGRAGLALYAARLTQSQYELRDGNVLRAQQLLNDCPWHLRGLEHDLLWTRCDSVQTLRGHTHAVHAAAFSPDGTRLATAGEDCVARVWDAATGAELLTLKGHAGYLDAVCFSPDGRRIASGGGDGTVGGPADVKVWGADAGDEQATLTGLTVHVNRVAFSPDGRHVAGAGDDRLVKVWDVGTGKVVRTLAGHAERVKSVAYSPDGTLLLSAGSDRFGAGEVKLWDAATGAEVRSIVGHESGCNDAAFSPDGRRIVTVTNLGRLTGLVKVWDADRGQDVRTIRAHDDGVRCVALSPDGSRIASGARGQEVTIWGAASGLPALSLTGVKGQAVSLAFSPDGRRLARGAWDGWVQVFDAATGREVLSFKNTPPGVVTGVAFSPDGKRLACSTAAPGGQACPVTVWDAEGGRALLSLDGHTGGAHDVAFSTDGRRVASAGGDLTVRLWDAASGAGLRVFKGHTVAVTGVAFSPDGKRLASVGEDETARVWDTETGQELLTLRGATSLIKVAFSPDGERVLAACGSQIGELKPAALKVWDAATGTELLVLNGHTADLTGLALSADGRRLVSSSWDGTVRVWDAHRNQEVRRLTGLLNDVNGVAFSPDGRRVYAWDESDALQAWTTHDGQPARPVGAPARPAPGPVTPKGIIQVEPGDAVVVASPDGFLRAQPWGTVVAVTDTRLRRPKANEWPLPDRAERQRYHAGRARAAEERQRWFAAAYHLGRLLLDDPDNADLKKRRDEALKKHAATP